MQWVISKLTHLQISTFVRKEKSDQPTCFQLKVFINSIDGEILWRCIYGVNSILLQFFHDQFFLVRKFFSNGPGINLLYICCGLVNVFFQLGIFKENHNEQMVFGNAFQIFQLALHPGYAFKIGEEQE